MNARLYDLSFPGHDAPKRVGQWLCNKWKIERVLGVGASGSVYAARHKNGNRVAIKVAHAELASHPQLRERFWNEARAVNRIRHRAVLGVHDEGTTEDGSSFLVMDLLEGQTLEAYLDRHGRLECEQVLAIAHEILDALIVAHEAGVLHRDLKPANLFLNWDGRVMLLDFGVARLSEGRPMTQLGIPMGTPSFMPPEQAAGRWQDVDARSDLWSLGATLFTLLSGRSVRAAGSTEDELRAAMTEPVRSLAHVRDAPAEVVALVDQALQLDREQRFQDAVSMQRQVAAAMQSLGMSLPEPSQVPALPGLITLDQERARQISLDRASSIRPRLAANDLLSWGERWPTGFRGLRPRSSRWAVFAATFVIAVSVMSFVSLSDKASIGPAQRRIDSVLSQHLWAFKESSASFWQPAGEASDSIEEGGGAKAAAVLSFDELESDESPPARAKRSSQRVSPHRAHRPSSRPARGQGSRQPVEANRGRSRVEKEEKESRKAASRERSPFEKKPSKEENVERPSSESKTVPSAEKKPFDPFAVRE